MLTDKLIKLRATRQDIESELFALKDKRIKLLGVIQHLEDEEMQLVGEVGGLQQGEQVSGEQGLAPTALSINNSRTAAALPLHAR
jgi:hypothetical protein